MPERPFSVKRRGAAVAPVTVSDRTCEAVLGVTWRPLRAFLRAHGVPYYRIGRRPVVRVEAVLAALEGRPPSARAEWDEEATIALAARGAASRRQ